ncbi:hypothetical protein GA0115261_100679 [Streptomyces sp. OspMP-M43]|nr:hypothetical protein GA0115261_100679 [Streptomyces sp. OspMP-M43]
MPVFPMVCLAQLMRWTGVTVCGSQANVDKSTLLLKKHLGC